MARPIAERCLHFARMYGRCGALGGSYFRLRIESVIGDRIALSPAGVSLAAVCCFSPRHSIQP